MWIWRDMSETVGVDQLQKPMEMRIASCPRWRQWAKMTRGSPNRFHNSLNGVLMFILDSDAHIYIYIYIHIFTIFYNILLFCPTKCPRLVERCPKPYCQFLISRRFRRSSAKLPRFSVLDVLKVWPDDERKAETLFCGPGKDESWRPSGWGLRKCDSGFREASARLPRGFRKNRTNFPENCKTLHKDIDSTHIPQAGVNVNPVLGQIQG